ncbi:MAG: glycosyltransferase, partial [Vicinamibacterales bacterium]
MTTDAVGGVWRYSVDLGRAFGRRGVRTTLAVMGPSPDDAQRREAEGAGLALIDRPYRLEWMEEPWADVERAGPWLLELARALRPDVVHLNGYAHAALPWTQPTLVVAH